MFEVLTDEQLIDVFHRDKTPPGHAVVQEMKLQQLAALRNVERAVVAALAARGEVDVDALAVKACVDIPCDCERISDNDWDRRLCAAHGSEPVVDAVTDAIRLAIAQQAARCLDTQWDGTDAACPAWWRGQDDGCRGMEKKLQQRIADLEAGTALAKLRAELGDANRRIAKLEKDRTRLNFLLEGEHGVAEVDRSGVDEICWRAVSTREEIDAAMKGE